MLTFNGFIYGKRFPFLIRESIVRLTVFKRQEFSMKKIMLCCSAGMSTSLLVKKMVEEAVKRGLEVDIKAFGVAEFEQQLANYQVVLLGPQVKYMQKDLQNKANAYGIKVEPINMMDYGMQKGAAVLDFALALIENKK
jgi:cellobiose PTS system EIIB component